MKIEEAIVTVFKLKAPELSQFLTSATQHSPLLENLHRELAKATTCSSYADIEAAARRIIKHLNTAKSQDPSRSLDYHVWMDIFNPDNLRLLAYQQLTPQTQELNGLLDRTSIVSVNNIIMSCIQHTIKQYSKTGVMKKLFHQVKVTDLDGAIARWQSVLSEINKNTDRHHGHLLRWVTCDPLRKSCIFTHDILDKLDAHFNTEGGVKSKDFDDLLKTHYDIKVFCETKRALSITNSKITPKPKRKKLSRIPEIETVDLAKIGAERFISTERQTRARDLGKLSHDENRERNNIACDMIMDRESKSRPDITETEKVSRMHLQRLELTEKTTRARIDIASEQSALFNTQLGIFKTTIRIQAEAEIATYEIYLTEIENKVNDFDKEHSSIDPNLLNDEKFSDLIRRYQTCQDQLTTLKTNLREYRQAANAPTLNGTHEKLDVLKHWQGKIQENHNALCDSINSFINQFDNTPIPDNSRLKSILLSFVRLIAKFLAPSQAYRLTPIEEKLNSVQPYISAIGLCR